MVEEGLMNPKPFSLEWLLTGSTGLITITMDYRNFWGLGIRPKGSIFFPYKG